MIVENRIRRSSHPTNITFRLGLLMGGFREVDAAYKGGRLCPHVSDSEGAGEEAELPWWHREPKMEDALIELFDSIKEMVDSGDLSESAILQEPEPEKPLSEAQLEKIKRENHRLYGAWDTHQVQRCSFCRKPGHNMRTCPVRKRR